jgi:hypothetical protein
LNRYAIIVGSNNGGPNKEELKYSHSDVDSVAKVFQELGNVSKKNIIILKDPNKKSFLKNFHIIEQNMKKNKSGRLEFIFYYSGHSDTEGILLNRDKISYEIIKDRITKMPVDVRIVILDSCSSGVFTRYKSGKKVKSFLDIHTSEIKGYAFITSSSADELSQESDKIGASFFTHYFTSGLRGAADSNNDALITLNEAYQYAYNETISLVEKQKFMAQHPNYAFNLQGKGELVMTDIRKSSTVLIIDKSVTGRFYIRNKNEKLIVELNKLKVQPVEIGLSPGDYSIVLKSADKYYKYETTLKDGIHIRLIKNNFKQIEKPTTFLAKSYLFSNHQLGLSRSSMSGTGLSYQTRLSKIFYTKITAGYFPNSIEIEPNLPWDVNVFSLGINLQVHIYEFKFPFANWRFYILGAWHYFTYKEKLFPKNYFITYYPSSNNKGDGLINPKLDKSYPKRNRRFGDITSIGLGMEISIFNKVSLNIDFGYGVSKFKTFEDELSLVEGIGVRYIF